MHTVRTSDLRRQVVDVREVVAAGAQVCGSLLQRVEPAIKVGEPTASAHLHALHMPDTPESTWLDFVGVCHAWQECLTGYG